MQLRWCQAVVALSLLPAARGKALSSIGRLEAAASGFTEAEERLCSDPIYYNLTNEQALIHGAFDRAEALQRDLGCRRSDILIVSLNNQIVLDLAAFANERNKPLLLLTKRGDATAVDAARESAQWVLGHADFVGGLEFQAVIIVGVDGGRVSPSTGNENVSSKSFLSYVSHNRLYVAISRARYRVELLRKGAGAKSVDRTGDRGWLGQGAGCLEFELTQQCQLNESHLETMKKTV